MAGRVKSPPAHDTSATGETPRVPKKSGEDLEAEARVRAHLRQQMRERSIDQAELARRIGSDDGNMSRILSGGRGIGLGQALRISRALKITPTRLLEEDPPDEFWDPGSRPPRDKKGVPKTHG